MYKTQGQKLFLGFCALLLGTVLLGLGAWFFNYRPPVEYARATDKEPRRDIAPLVLIGAGSLSLGVGAVLLLRRRGD